jgi:hypothetical protein
MRFFFLRLRSHIAKREMTRRPAIPPITPPITAVFWLPEEEDVDEEVGDCVGVVV